MNLTTSVSAYRNHFFVVLFALSMLAASCAEQPQPESVDATSGQVLFRDQFIAGQTGNWLLEQDEVSSVEIANEQLVLNINQPNTIQFATLLDPEFSDFVVEVDGRQRAGSGDSSYGILFRVQDDQRFYRFSVTSNGLYVVERHNADGTWTRLIQEWLPSEAINQGLNVTNRLKVIANGPEFTIYVNDILLQQLTDSSYQAGNVALSAGTFGGESLQVSFDDLVVYGYEPGG